MMHPFLSPSLIPPQTLETLKNYIRYRYPPGGFTTAVLENDLKEAVSRADDYNISAIPAIVSWLYNKAPGECWGSPKRVKDWLFSTEKLPEFDLEGD